MANTGPENMEDFVAEIDTGGRNPAGFIGNLIATIAFIWAVFQLYIASNVPFWLSEVTNMSWVVTNSNARLIHLAFGFVLAALAYPLFKSSSRQHVPWYDWLLAVLGAGCCLYIVFLKKSLLLAAV